MSLQTVTFPSKDGLTITADYYQVDHPLGCILLCHRSHFNRGEYKETAPKLNQLGYSCLAIDQRSGMKVLGTTNETYALAKQKGLETGYAAARPDIEAAVAYLYKKNHHKPIMLLGSSYSAALALIVATQHSDMVKAVIAFSPGEYLKHIAVTDAISTLHIPVFVTSAKKEVKDTTKLIAPISPAYVTHYVPASEGAHGSRSLWAVTPGSQEYWQALKDFLAGLKKD